MADQALPVPQRVLDANGLPVPGARVTYYASGTNTLVSVYEDEAGTVLSTNPVLADGNGVLPQRFLVAKAKAVIRDADGVTLYTIDPVPVSLTGSTGAASVTFAPTVQIPYADVQSAIEGVNSDIRGVLAGAGVGITGDAQLIANIDAVNVPSGEYRFATGTTGTFPSGVTAATTGIVDINRQSATQGTMTMLPAGSSIEYARALVAGVWGAWREVPSVPNPATAGTLAVRGASAWAALPPGTAFQRLRVNSAGTGLEYATNDFASAEITPAADDRQTFAHGLGAAPTDIRIILRCNTAEHGFSVNDTVILSPGVFDVNSAQGVQAAADATNIFLGIYAIYVRHKTTGTGGGAWNLITYANWRLRVVARL